MSIQGFWGLQVEPGRQYTQTVQVPFMITMASLPEKMIGRSRTTLTMTVDNNNIKYSLCSLTPFVKEQQFMTLSLVAGETVTFAVGGANAIHLTGNYVFDDCDNDDQHSTVDPIQNNNEIKNAKTIDVGNKHPINKKQQMVEDEQNPFDDYGADYLQFDYDDDDYKHTPVEDTHLKRSNDANMQSRSKKSKGRSYENNTQQNLDLSRKMKSVHHNESLSPSSSQQQKRSTPTLRQRTARGKLVKSAICFDDGEDFVYDTTPRKSLVVAAKSTAYDDDDDIFEVISNNNDDDDDDITDDNDDDYDDDDITDDGIEDWTEPVIQIQLDPNDYESPHPEMNQRNTKRQRDTAGNRTTVNKMQNKHNSSDNKGKNTSNKKNSHSNSGSPSSSPKPTRSLYTALTENPEQLKSHSFPSGLVVQDKKIGYGEFAAKFGHRIGIRYLIKLQNAQVIYRHITEPPYEIHFDSGHGSFGWHIGALGMKVGGERQITLPTALACQSGGIPNNIPRTSETLTFDIQMVTFDGG